MHWILAWFLFERALVNSHLGIKRGRRQGRVAGGGARVKRQGASVKGGKGRTPPLPPPLALACYPPFMCVRFQNIVCRIYHPLFVLINDDGQSWSSYQSTLNFGLLCLSASRCRPFTPSSHHRDVVSRHNGGSAAPHPPQSREVLFLALTTTNKQPQQRSMRDDIVTPTPHPV